jgi:hypothetical protein
MLPDGSLRKRSKGSVLDAEDTDGSLPDPEMSRIVTDAFLVSLDLPLEKPWKYCRDGLLGAGAAESPRSQISTKSGSSVAKKPGSPTASHSSEGKTGSTTSSYLTFDAPAGTSFAGRGREEQNEESLPPATTQQAPGSIFIREEFAAPTRCWGADLEPDSTSPPSGRWQLNPVTRMKDLVSKMKTKPAQQPRRLRAQSLTQLVDKERWAGASPQRVPSQRFHLMNLPTLASSPLSPDEKVASSMSGARATECRPATPQVVALPPPASSERSNLPEPSRAVQLRAAAQARTGACGIETSAARPESSEGARAPEGISEHFAADAPFWEWANGLCNVASLPTLLPPKAPASSTPAQVQRPPSPPSVRTSLPKLPRVPGVVEAPCQYLLPSEVDTDFKDWVSDLNTSVLRAPSHLVIPAPPKVSSF